MVRHMKGVLILETYNEQWKTFHTTSSLTHSRLYQVSNTGKVRSRNNTMPEHYGCWKYHTLVNGGYNSQYIKVSCGRGIGYQYVHKLVLEAFISPRPSGLQANHKDLDTENNKVENLEWITPSENASHMQRAYGGVNQFTNHRTKEQAREFLRSQV